MSLVSHLLEETIHPPINRSTLDDIGPLGGDQGMAVLKEMNELEAGHDDFPKRLTP
jgi:hypothetical protein